MSDIQWNDEFLLGLPEIDDQHKKLFSMVAFLDDSIAKGVANKELSHVLDELVAYLKEHFSCEEDLLKDHPEWAEHHSQHWQFTEKVLQFLWDFKKRDKEGTHSRVACEIRDFLADWLKEHIACTDRRYFKELAVSK